MPRPLRIQFPEALYHVTARGVDKAPIVRDDHDRMRWCEYLKAAVTRFGLELYAFALLDNHFHLFLSAPNTNLNAAMHYLNGAHAMYFNTRHQRKGHLFEKRYHATLIESQGHYTTISRYIHLNPVRAGLADRPEQYAWSSYPGYHSGRMPLSWLNYTRVLAEFGEGKEARERYRKFVTEAIGKKLTPPWAYAAGGWLIGTPKFTARVYTLLAKDRKDNRWDSRASQGKRAIEATLDEIAQAVCKECRVSAEQLKSRESNARAARRAFALLAREHAGYSLKSIAAHIGVNSNAAVAHVVRRAADRVQKNEEFRRLITRLDSNRQLKGSGTFS
jgi:REP element-mobilizing transposase RayT